MTGNRLLLNVRSRVMRRRKRCSNDLGRNGSVCGPLGSSWGTVALIAFGVLLLFAFTGLLKSAYRCGVPPVWQFLVVLIFLF